MIKKEVTAILVDDEVKALSMLELKLNNFFPQISIIAKYDDPLQAIDGINKLTPQIVFMDINMPDYNAFELLNHIYNPAFELIFVTAYDQHAIEAIKYAAVGYVLKPINETELKEATLKALHKVHVKNNTDTGRETAKLNKISIPFNNGFIVKSLHDIIRFEGFNGYTRIYLKNENLTSSYNIGLFNKMLADTHFRMVHKSHLINLDHVDKYLNEGIIILSNGDKIPVSRNNKNEIAQLFKNNF